MRYWFIPTSSGDVRLESIGVESCLLTVVDPTTAEREVLQKFFTHAAKDSWIRSIPPIEAKGETRVALTVTLEDCGPVLAGFIHGKDSRTWTAIRYQSGKVDVIDGSGVVGAKGEAAPAKDKPVAAATVKEPSKGCPAPEPCQHRASEVLKAFSTRSQWEQWNRDGFMLAVGNATGKVYQVHHRNVAARRGLGHSLTCEGREVCVWDATVPAEEEALASKLAVEHREHWLVGMN